MTKAYTLCKESADYIRTRIPCAPEIAVILGTGCGMLASRVQDPIEIPYGDIPNFLRSTAPGHAGKLIFGRLGGKTVICMSGRFHYYEGYSFEQLSIPIRVLKLLGAHTVVLTNAAGGVNLDYKPGDVMVIKDHINLMGASPMRGENAAEFGERFFDVGNMYTKKLRELALRCGESSPLTLHEGVYYYTPGPHFETPAEIRAIRILGGDNVGMSTVTEALTAAHCGMQVLGLSVVTNMAAGVLDTPLSGDDVDAVGQKITADLSALVEDIISKI